MLGQAAKASVTESRTLGDVWFVDTDDYITGQWGLT